MFTAFIKKDPCDSHLSVSNIAIASASLISVCPSIVFVKSFRKPPCASRMHAPIQYWFAFNQSSNASRAQRLTSNTDGILSFQHI
ncbi:hypothetical protein L195_g003287 [Trifolium pratense]|uniref:Uncharacterized protein n=1 Tax=Trifolium pratense TaxID=57577 RepID=A0A2K3NUT7_TRIPR|nr:hypothetical protein L195_g003287 [Trifolium pratense]